MRSVMMFPHGFVLVFSLLLSARADDPVAAEPAVLDPRLPQFAVIYEKNYKFEEAYSVVDRATYLDRQKHAEMLPAVMRKALIGARNEWNAQERKRVGTGKNRVKYGKNGKQDRNRRKNGKNSVETGLSDDPYKYKRRGFPMLLMNRAPLFRCVKLHETQSEADDQCTLLTEGLARRGSMGFQKGNAVKLENTLPSQLKKGAVGSGGSKKSKNSSAERADKEDARLAEAKAKAMRMFEAHYARVLADVEATGKAGLRKPNPKYLDSSKKKKVSKPRAIKRLGDG